MNCYICKHSKESHRPSMAYPGEYYCFSCVGEIKMKMADAYHKFPDNLDLIEHLAKERKLI